MPWEQRQAVPALLLIELHLCFGKQLLVENQVMKRLPWDKGRKSSMQRNMWELPLGPTEILLRCILFCSSLAQISFSSMISPSLSCNLMSWLPEIVTLYLSISSLNILNNRKSGSVLESPLGWGWGEKLADFPCMTWCFSDAEFDNVSTEKG